MTAHAPLEAVVIGGSAGSVAALGALVPRLTADFVPVLVVIHVLPTSRTLLPEIFAPRCAMRVTEAEAFEPIVPGTISFAPSDYHLLVEPDRRASLSIGPPVHFSRPSIDVLFESASEAYGAGLACVVLTGASADGARGAARVRANGGWVFLQDPADAEAAAMPLAALAAVPDARVVSLDLLASELLALPRRK